MKRKKIKYFSGKEIRDLLISVIVLGFLFSFRMQVLVAEYFLSFLLNWFLSSLIVGIAFIGHELAHKFIAMRYELKAEYVLWPQGVLISLAVFFLTGGSFIFAALGFVSISTFYSVRLGYRYVSLTLEEAGIISASGPAANLVIALISAMFTPFSELALISMNLNLILAIFNLIPFPPLDGSKVFTWSRIAWLALIGTSITLLILLPLISWVIGLIIALVVLVVIIFYAYSLNL
jgi:Zn-dependent protease